VTFMDTVRRAKASLLRQIKAGTPAAADARIASLRALGQFRRADNVLAARIAAFGDPQPVHNFNAPREEQVPQAIADRPEYRQPLELAATPHPLIEADTRQGLFVAQVMGGVAKMLDAHHQALKLELRAITNDNSILRQNLALLNTAMGDFQRLQVIPLREMLETLRTEQGSSVIENQRKIEALIQALTRTIDAAGGLIPPDLKQSILEGRFEDHPHQRASDMVHVDKVQAMIDEAYDRGRSEVGHGG